MADRVLPSRDSFSDADIKTLYKHGFFDEEKIIMAYVSGRLVDREAIDYEAAADQLGLIDWMAMQTKHPSSVEMPPYEWLLAEANAVVDAALPDLEA